MRTIALVTALILSVGGASMAEAAKVNPKARITMADGGAIVIELYPDVAPKHVENFVTLTDKGFYNGLKFHRVEPGFVVQTGDPKGDGTGGPGYTIKAEFNEKPHLEGTLGMARAQHPDSAGSQFYICLAPSPFLDRKYTVFGQVVQGMDVVKKIKRGDAMQKVEILK
jgi:peptidyl-prolyl cis-trans isomerase B (cyclophilin B)